MEVLQYTILYSYTVAALYFESDSYCMLVIFHISQSVPILNTKCMLSWSLVDAYRIDFKPDACQPLAVPCLVS